MLIEPKVRHFVIKMEEATPNWTPTTTSAFIKHFFKINYKTCYLIHLYSGVPKYFWLKFELPPWTISFKLFLLRGISRPTKKWCWVATTTPEIIWMSVTTEHQSFSKTCDQSNYYSHLHCAWLSDFHISKSGNYTLWDYLLQQRRKSALLLCFVCQKHAQHILIHNNASPDQYVHLRLHKSVPSLKGWIWQQLLVILHR